MLGSKAVDIPKADAAYRNGRTGRALPPLPPRSPDLAPSCALHKTLAHPFFGDAR